MKKASLAEVMYQLELVQEAYTKVEHLESEMNVFSQSVSGVEKSLKDVVDKSHLEMSLSDIKKSIRKEIKNQFEDLSASIETRLKEKIDKEDLKSIISSKVNWKEHRQLSEGLNALKTSLDKHIFSDFAELKRYIKLELREMPRTDIFDHLNDTNKRIDLIAHKIEQLSMKDQLYSESSQSDSSGESSESEHSQEDNDFVKVKKKRNREDYKGTEKESIANQSIGKRKSTKYSKVSRSSRKKYDYKDLEAKIANLNKDISDVRSLIKEPVDYAQDIFILQERIAKIQQSQKQDQFLISNFEKNLKDALEQFEGLTSINKTESDTASIKAYINEKLSRLPAIEKNLKGLYEDYKSSKLAYKDKFNEIGLSISTLNQSKQTLLREIQSIQGIFNSRCNDIQNSYQIIEKKIFEVEGPLKSLVNDQKNELQTLCKDIQRHQQLLRNLMEEAAPKTLNSSRTASKSCVKKYKKNDLDCVKAVVVRTMRHLPDLRSAKQSSKSVDLTNFYNS